MNAGQKGIAGLYPILDASRLAQVAIPHEALACLLAELAIGCVQLRCKDASQDFVAFATPWLAALRRHAPRTKIILNDRLDLVLALGADGVHVGQEDHQAGVCRQVLGREKLLGVSTHNLEEVAQAVRDGADYVGFGPVFATQSKVDAQAVQGLSGLAKACAASPLPLVAIGGITADTLAAVARQGATAAAMISTLLQPDWRQSFAQCHQLWTQAR